MNNVEINELQENFFNELKQTHVMYVKQQISLLNAFEKEFGSKVVNIVEDVSKKLILNEFSKNTSGNETIGNILSKLWKPLKLKGYEYTVKQTDTTAKINCTKCPLANLYKKLNGEKWGYHLYCSVDEELTRSFNPTITFERDKTLMKGDEYCNHFYKNDN